LSTPELLLKSFEAGAFEVKSVFSAEGVLFRVLPNSLEKTILSKWGINFDNSRLITDWHNITYSGVVVPQQTLEPLGRYSTDKLLIRLKRKASHEISSFVAAECQILIDVHANLDLICPVPLVCLDGGFCQQVELEGQMWILTLFRWIEGRTAEVTLPEAYFFQVGALTGKLHHFFQHRYTPSILDRPVRDITHGTQEANSFFDPSVAFARMEKRYRACIERFLDTHHQTFSTIFNRFGHCLIHGDIIQKNIIVLDGRLGLIDFDECAWFFQNIRGRPQI
jgi:hypothetical protein